MSARSILARMPACALLAFLPSPVLAQSSGAGKDEAARIAELAAAAAPDLGALYKDIHAHPELAFGEERTAARLAKELRSAGFEVSEHVGRTGVVSVYRNGQGPVVLVRTELDALPMEEKTGLPYASRAKTQWKGEETFVAHSCGHDVHMAAWLGTARTLVALKDRWQGTLVFIGQPAEEGTKGARAMLADGLLTRFPRPDYAFALHTSPAAYGTIEYSEGVATSNSNHLDITFHGRGGHGSAPNESIDPILIAAHFIVDVQSVVSREKDPKEFGVVTIGAVKGGSAGNIIPDTVVLRGTIRSYREEVGDKLVAGVRRTALAVAAMAGAPEPEIDLETGGRAVFNDVSLAQGTAAVFVQAFGADKVRRIGPITASEDFSLYGREGVPSFFFFIGVYAPDEVAAASRPGGKPLPFNHSPYFAPVPGPSIDLGVRAMSLAVLHVLGTPRP